MQARKTYHKISLQAADCKVLYPFLMPNEEHLGGFSQMGFHVISCVEWLIDVECLCECQFFSYYKLISYFWMYGAILLISEWMIDKALLECVNKI